MWSFVGSKDNRQWIWLAIDERSAAVVGVYVGARDWGRAEGLWHSLPAVYRQCVVAYTDFWSSYAEIFPASRHRAVGKETGRTDQIEHFNNTMRTRRHHFPWTTPHEAASSLVRASHRSPSPLKPPPPAPSPGPAAAPGKVGVCPQACP
jgi:insertion element IS1 protein InsB